MDNHRFNMKHYLHAPPHRTTLIALVPTLTLQTQALLLVGRELDENLEDGKLDRSSVVESEVISRKTRSFNRWNIYICCNHRHF